MACEQIDKFPSQMDAKKAKEYLLSNKSKLISMGRTFDRQKDWLNNAIQSHQEKSFQGVLVKSNTPNEAGILKVDEMTFEESEWNIDSDSKIPRTTEAIVEAAAPLLRISRSVALVDRNFHFYEYQKEPIIKLFKQAREATPLFFLHACFFIKAGHAGFRTRVQKIVKPLSNCYIYLLTRDLSSFAGKSVKKERTNILDMFSRIAVVLVTTMDLMKGNLVKLLM